MATEEEKRKRRFGIGTTGAEESEKQAIGIRTPTAEQVGQGVRSFVPRAIDKANTFVRNTSPVREIYGAADMVGRFGKGLFGGQKTEQPGIAAMQGKQAKQGEAQAATLPQQPVQDIAATQQKRVFEPQQQEIAKTQGMRFSGADQGRVNTLGLEGALTPPSANIGLTPMKKEDGSYIIRESINGGPGGPALQKPFTSAKRFRQLTGYDRKGNPIYSNGAAEMAAANTGIASYNSALVNKYKQRDDAFNGREFGPKKLSPEEELKQRYMDAASPEEKKRISQDIAAMSGTTQQGLTQEQRLQAERELAEDYQKRYYGDAAQARNPLDYMDEDMTVPLPPKVAAYRNNFNNAVTLYGEPDAETYFILSANSDPNVWRDYINKSVEEKDSIWRRFFSGS